MANLTSLPLEASPDSQPGRACLDFWFRMGGALTQINVYRSEINSSKAIRVSQLQGPVEDMWRHEFVAVNPDQSKLYNIVIEGVMFEKSSYLAIDDLNLDYSECPTPCTCDFDLGMCGFANIQRADQFDWVLEVEDSGSGTPNGILTAQFDVGVRLGDNAEIVSDPVDGQIGCHFILSFMVRAMDDRAQTTDTSLSIYSRTLKETMLNKLLLKKVGILSSNIWKEVSFEVPFSVSQEIIFDFVYNDNEPLVSIDNVTLNSKCNNSSPTPSSSSSTSPSHSVPSSSPSTPIAPKSSSTFTPKSTQISTAKITTSKKTSTSSQPAIPTVPSKPHTSSTTPKLPSSDHTPGHRSGDKLYKNE